MSTFLYRLGRWCAHHAWKVLLAWLIILGALGGGAASVGMQLSNDFEISDSEAMEGLAILRERLPQAAGTTEPVLITASDGDIRAHEKAIEGLIEDASAIDGIAMVANPFDPLTEAISDAGDAALVQV
ncbi:MAG: MMPL family transporter, partial [Arcanobacterium sp.]|nr:MMPL family transporter [Arcanobacterium sp.]